MANVLKWGVVAIQWIRLFLRHDGRRCGRVIIPRFVPDLAPKLVPAYLVQDVINNAIYTFPLLLLLSVIGCLLGTYLGEPEDEAILKHFYKTTRPWAGGARFETKCCRKIRVFSLTTRCSRTG